jgi:NAD(P)-dependent dehydrogenase (short-subunit alcohol dehydrogenase family)
VEELLATAPDVQVSCLPLDLASLASVDGFVAAFVATHPRLHLLVLNAGFAREFSAKMPELTEEGFESTVGTNHLAHFYLTLRLLPALAAAAPSRVVVVSSRAYEVAPTLDTADLQLVKPGAFGGFAAYAQSKLLNLLFAYELNRRYVGAGITANAVHPGTVPTSNFFAHSNSGVIKFVMDWVMPWLPLAGGTQTLEQAAGALMAAAFHPTGGHFFDVARLSRSRQSTMDTTVWAAMWTESKRLLAGVGHPVEDVIPGPAALVPTALVPTALVPTAH